MSEKPGLMLYHHFNNIRNTSNLHMTDEKLRELLRQMAITLGISEVLNRDDFSRVYFPTVLAEEQYVRNLQRVVAKSHLEGQLNPPAANVASQFVRGELPVDRKTQARGDD